MPMETTNAMKGPPEQKTDTVHSSSIPDQQLQLPPTSKRLEELLRAQERLEGPPERLQGDSACQKYEPKTGRELANDELNNIDLAHLLVYLSDALDQQPDIDAPGLDNLADAAQMTKTLEECKSELTSPQRKRIIAKIKQYGKEHDVTLNDCNVRCVHGMLCWSFEFNRGGTLHFYPGFLCEQTCKKIVKELGMDIDGDKKQSKFLRQYRMRNTEEPRLHGLISCDERVDAVKLESDDDIGEHQQQQNSAPASSVYKYHHVCMKPRAHISEFPCLFKVNRRAAKVAGIKTWKIGCDAILYRNGNDNIGYHADDTQGESAIFCIVLESEEVRHLHVKPKGTTQDRKQGDVEVKVLAKDGDAYQMDGEMQQHYVHALPRKKEKPCAAGNEEISKHRRVALIFRDGDRTYEEKDNGSDPSNFNGKRTITQEERYPLGHMENVLQEGEVFTREYLLDQYAISNQEGGVSGTMAYGCSAVVVSRQSADHFEIDKFSTLYYSSTGNQRGGSLFTSITKYNHPVRVFRSSVLNNAFAACKPRSEGESGNFKKKPERAVYRYDGLYHVESCFAVTKDGKRYQPKEPPSKDTEYTFRLKRLPTARIMATAGYQLAGFFNTYNSTDFLKFSLRRGTIRTTIADSITTPRKRKGVESGSQRQHCDGASLPMLPFGVTRTSGSPFVASFPPIVSPESRAPKRRILAYKYDSLLEPP